MAISPWQGLSVGLYLIKHKLKGTEKFPLVLMLEPLFRCNLECAGCGKIQYPEEILRKRLSPQECVDAALECGAPIVSIAGGEPLCHPEIEEIVARLIEAGKYIYLCTNGMLLEKSLDKLRPSRFLTLSVHMDGLEERHDHVVCRKGVFKTAIAAMREAKKRGFRVTTNTTVFEGEDPEEVRRLFDFLQDDVGTDGIMVSPGYSYRKAPDQDHFLKRERTHELFREILKGRKRWDFNHSPLFLDFLEGKIDYQCTAWGNPTRNVFGWQKPCYLMSDGYVKTFKELIEDTPWEKYGTGRDPRCRDCMVHCGYEPTAVLDMMSSPRRALQGIGILSGPKDPIVHAPPPVPAPIELVATPADAPTPAGGTRLPVVAGSAREPQGSGNGCRAPLP